MNKLILVLTLSLPFFDSIANMQCKTPRTVEYFQAQCKSNITASEHLSLRCAEFLCTELPYFSQDIFFRCSAQYFHVEDVVRCTALMSEFEAVQIAASDFVVLKECPASNDREAYISCVTHLQIEFENSPISFMLKYADKYSLLVNPLDLLNNE